MNCTQARTLLSAYRELHSGEIDTTELDKHLEQCASCRAEMAQYAFIGDQVRALKDAAPEPAPDAHAKLMRALAEEQIKFLQKSAPNSVSTPEFLQPYVQERAQTKQERQAITRFSTAETGPLPLLNSRRRRPQMSQFAVLGLAAAFLMVLMTGGLTSLLLLARNNPTAINNSNGASVHHFAEVEQHTYATNTLYQHITSAVGTARFVYYTAYGDEANSGWMLLRMDRATTVSSPLLETPSSSPLVILKASDNWLVWLQYNEVKPAHNLLPHDNNTFQQPRSWSLWAISLTPQQLSLTDQQKLPTPIMLTRGVFDKSTAPLWTTSPVQGTWFIGDRLLVALIDANGSSHLRSYQLGAVSNKMPIQEIASADTGSVLVSPTANSTGSEIYWAEEWLSTSDGQLHSNIWEQRTVDTNTHWRGNVLDHSTTTQSIYRADTLSFDPLVVNDALFFVSTSGIAFTGEGTVTTTGSPQPISIGGTPTTITPRVDTSIYPVQPDTSVHGTVFMIPLDGVNVGEPTMMGNAGQSSALQAGGDYVLWQDDTGYKMYDVAHQADVIIGDTLNGAALLAVNGDTTVWIVGNPANTPGTKVGTTLLTFNWPD